MITIFTATFNRENYLGKLYQSLCRQTDKDFEWIIVDDGSTDNTGQLVEKWQEKQEISIRYFKKNNGGKHTAINFGIDKVNSEWILFVDSDDCVVENAVETIKKWIVDIRDDRIAAVSGTKIYTDGTTIGGTPKIADGQYIETGNANRRKYNLLGDMAETYKTAILKKYPFPVFDGENFISEGSVWNRISYDGYVIRWYNEPLVICEYLEDGLSSNSAINNVKNFKGFSYCQKMLYENEKGILKLFSVGIYAYFAKEAKKEKKGCIRYIGCSKFYYDFSFLIYYLYRTLKKILSKN